MLQDASQLIQLTKAGVIRKGEWLVRGVDLSVRSGEIVTLIGPNGSGKSTTTKMALGILKPDEGSLKQAEGLVVGYVPQRLRIDWTMPLTVARFMSLTGKIGAAEKEDALEKTGVVHLLKSEMRHLSGGEFQRVLLARAIARKPNLLVLDEPVQGVDFSGEIALYDLITKIRDDLGCGILLVSHDLHMVMAATDQVICLNGHVCCHGTPTAVASSETYKAMFGERASGLALYEHRHDHTHLEDGTVMHKDGSITDHCHPDDGHHKSYPDDGHHKSHPDHGRHHHEHNEKKDS